MLTHFQRRHFLGTKCTILFLFYYKKLKQRLIHYHWGIKQSYFIVFVYSIFVMSFSEKAAKESYF